MRHQCWISGQINQLEFQFGGLPQQCLERSRIAEARNLNDDPVLTLADDRWFACAHPVDPLANNVGRRIHRHALGLIDPGGSGREDDLARVNFQIPVPLARHRSATRQRLQHFACRLTLGRIGDHEAHGTVLGRDIANFDLGLPQAVAHIFGHRIEPLASDLVRARFKQDMAAPGQVEA